MKTIYSLVTIMISLFLLTSPAQAGEVDYLSADQVKAIIAGKTVHAEHLKKGFDFKVYFDADGETAIRQQQGETTTTTYSFQGKKHCIKWRGRNRCAFIQDNGDGTYSRINRKGKAKVKWVKIVEGKDL